MYTHLRIFQDTSIKDKICSCLPHCLPVFSRKDCESRVNRQRLEALQVGVQWGQSSAGGESSAVGGTLRT